MWAGGPVGTTYGTDGTLEDRKPALNHRPMTCTGFGERRGDTHPDLLLHQLPGVVNLLGGAADGEDLEVGVGVGGWIPLQLYPSP